MYGEELFARLFEFRKYKIEAQIRKKIYDGFDSM